MDFIDAMKNRRSFYGISRKSTVKNEKIAELVKFATKHTPSAFHSQSQMTAILFGEKHNQLWDLVLSVLRNYVPAAGFAKTEEKIKGFRAGYGTVLYFNDDSITRALQEQNPLYADNFPVWAEQANGMLQFAIWSLLECEGLGASLQHYNPLIDEEVRTAFGLPQNWRLIAQMPFGAPTAQPDEKDFIDIDTRVKIIE